MADYDLVIRNAKIVTEDRQLDGDIAVKDGRVAALEPAIAGKGAREIDAGGKFVLPGGVDSHCHIEQKSGFGIMCADDFYTGTVSAAFGGTTTVIPFAAQHRGMSLRQVVKDYHEAATPKAVIDYAFHLIITDPIAAGAGPGAAGADQGRLHLVQDLHDLRRHEGQRLPDARHPGARAARRRAGHGACREPRHDPAGWRITWSTRAMSRPSSTPSPMRASPRPRRPTARSRWRGWSMRRC